MSLLEREMIDWGAKATRTMVMTVIYVINDDDLMVRVMSLDPGSDDKSGAVPSLYKVYNKFYKV